VEHALGSRAFVKAEYRYSNYEAGLSRNQVVGGIGLRF
jgi:outer membrane immunogenic protein